MTRTVSIYAHDLTPEAWQALVADVQTAFSKARAASPDAKALGGSAYDSHGTPPSVTF